MSSSVPSSGARQDQTPDDPNATHSLPAGGDPTRDHDPPPAPSLGEEVHATALRFDQAWQQGTPPDLLAFLPPDGPVREAAFRELLAIDEERRRAAGLPTRSDEYRAAVPDVTADLTGDAPGAVGSAHPLVVPGFEILGELGRGAMGVVYDARQIRLNRRVALKVVRNPSAAAATFLRFLAEAEVIAAVRHPNVVQVYESGQHAGVPFLAMECLPGGTLADRLKATGRLAPREVAELVGKIARGVAAAHDLGIVHRDLKPGNVLFDSAGEPKVADFGLAKRQAVDLTATQALMGTPAYMAPEQAGQRAKFVGPPADVWALGIILYECVSGKRPFAGDSTAEVLSRIVNEEPAAVRSRRSDVPCDLETIIGKCLAKEPERRYAAAGELADDLDRFTRGEPILARPVGRFERAFLWARRKPAVAAAYGLSAVAVALAAVVLIVAGFWRTAELAKGEAESTRDQLAREKTATEKARDEAVRLRGVADDALRGEQAAKAEVEREREQVIRVNYGRTVQIAYQAAKAERFREARTLLESTRREFRGWEFEYVSGLIPSGRNIKYNDDRLLASLVWSPDGRRVLAAEIVGKAEILDAISGRLVATIPEPSEFPISHAAWSPDSSSVVTTSGGVAWVWDAATGKSRVKLAGHTGPINSVAWGPGDSGIVTASADGTARIWNPTTGNVIRELKGHEQPVNSADWSPDGSRVLALCADGTARVWGAETGKVVCEFRDPAGWEKVRAWSPNGKRIVTANRDHTARVWDAITGKLLAELPGEFFAIDAVCWNPQGTRVVTGNWDATARVWDAETGKRVAELKGHAISVETVAWSPTEARIVTASRDQTVRVWDAETCAETLALPGRAAARFSPDGSRILTWDGQRPVAYDARTSSKLPGREPAIAPPPREADW